MFPDWNHNDDKIMEYFVFGAGECCFVMAILVLMLKDGISITKKMQNIRFQIFCWIMWTCTEFYYGITGVEYPFISTIHVILCLLVLWLSYKATTELKSSKKYVIQNMIEYILIKVNLM